MVPLIDNFLHSGEDGISEISEIVPKIGMDDLEGSVLNLARLQFMNRLDVLDLANGKIGDIKTSARLSWQDCEYISDLLLSGRVSVFGDPNPQYAVAVEWLRVAERFDDSKSNIKKLKLLLLCYLV